MRPRSLFIVPSLRTALNVSVILALMLTVLAVPSTQAAAFTSHTYADSFDFGFGFSSGTAAWETDWIESGESDGFLDGAIVVGWEVQCPSGGADPCLIIGKGGPAEAAVERELDLGWATSATLEFDSNRHKHGTGTHGTVELSVSDDGGTGWVVLKTWDLSVNPGVEPETFDISEYASSNTRIRFEQFSGESESHINIDNVTITADDAWYLKSDGVGRARLGSFPTQTSLPNYDPSHDAEPGRFLQRSSIGLGETDIDKHQWWISPARGQDLDGPVALSVWSSMKDFSTGIRGVVDAGLFDCLADGSDCILITTSQLDLADWSGGTTDWVERQIDFGSVTHPIASTRSLAIKLVVNNNSGDDMWFAYDTVAYPSRLNVTLYVPVTNLAPVFGQDLADRSTPEGTAVSISAAATDPDLDTLAYSATGLPSGVSIDPATGLISGTIDFTASGTYSTAITVTDDGSPVLSAVDAFTWTVTEVNRPPIFIQDLVDRSDPRGTLISFKLDALDPDASDTLTYSATGLPQGLTIDSVTGRVSGAIGPNASGTTAVTITVTDDGSPPMTDIDTFAWTLTTGENTYLIANTGGANGGDDLLTAVDLTDPNPVTNEMSIGTGTGTTNIEAADIQPGSNVLFAVQKNRIGTIDVTSGVFTPHPADTGIGSGVTGLRAFDNIKGLAFHPFTGDLYGTHRRGGVQPDLLFRIDPMTGSHVPGAFGGDDYVTIQIQGIYFSSAELAFDPTDGQLYMVHGDLSGNRSIATLDPATGATSTVGASPNDFVSLAFDESGRMFGATETGGAETIFELSKSDASVLNSIVVDNGSNYESMVISYSADPNMAPTFSQDLTDRTDPEGSPISMAAGASDPNIGDVLTYSATDLPPGLAIDPSDGTISGTISFSASGTYATRIEVTDNGIPNLNAIDTFTWTIADINRNPVFDADLGDQTDAEGATIALSAGATDPDPSDDLLYTASGLPNGLTIDPGTGLISGTIDFDAAGTSPYLVSVTVTDDGAPPMAAAPDTFRWLVTNTNRPPLMVDTGAHTTPELVPFSLTVSASDPDGTTPSFTDGGSLPAWATLTDNLNGTATISGTPGVGGSGTTTVTLVASDGGLPNLSDSTTFDLTVTNTNVAPTITNPGNQTTPEAASFSLTLFANDVDGTTVSFSDAGTLPSWASITDNGDDTATIIGTPGYSDQGTTTATITVTDGLLTNDTVFDITVTNTNQSPAIDPITDQSVAENDPFTLLISGSDPDGTTVSFTDSGTLPAWATLIDNANNTATISGNPGFADEGSSAVTITVSDGELPDLSATTSFNLIVDNTNRPPTINPVVDQSVAENSAFSVTVSSADPDGTFPSMAAVGLPSWATWLDNEDGTSTLSGTPGFADQATSTVTVTVADGGFPKLSATTTFDLTVTNVNRAPTVDFVLDQAVAENNAFNLTIGASDPDGTIVSFTDSGTLPTWATLLDNGDNSATVTGTPGFTDEAITSVFITVQDGDTPNLSASTGFDIAVFNTNRPPIADPIADQFTAEAIALNLIVTASDPDSTTVSFTDSGSLPAWATLTDNGDNTATINGTPGYSDAGVTSVSITVEDGGVPDLSATATFDLSVVNTNRPPVADLVPDQFGAEAVFFSTTITASDPDGTIVSFTDSGTLPPWATLLDNGDNTATITGTPTYSDSATTGVTITVSDGGAPNYTAATSFDITVANTNQPPTVGPIVDQTAAEDAPFSLVISGADPDGTTVTLTDSGTLPGWASLLDNGDNTATITGTPGFGDEGVTSATITASDGTLSGTASFDITVSNTNQSPTLNPIASQSVAEGDPMSLVVAGSDPDGTTLTFSATLPAWASLTDNGDNTATIGGSPGFDDEATTTVTIMVEDGGSPNLSASTTFGLTVTNTNRAPTMGVVADQLVTENDPFTMTVFGSDPDETIVAIADSGTLPPWAAMTDNGDGTATISGTPGFDDAGTTLVTITGSDGDLSSSTTFELTVAGTNRPPTLDPIGYQAADEQSLVSFVATASDPDGDAYTFSLSNPGALPPGVAITPGGYFTWIPGESEGPGTYLVTVVVTDDASPSLTDSQEVTIVVAETNQLPSIPAMQPFSANTGTAFTHAVVVTDPDQPASNHTFWLQDAPAGVTINPGTGVISWTPAIDQGPASHTFTVGVTDAGTPTFTATQTITVNVALAAPIPTDTGPPEDTPDEVPEEIVEPVVEPPIEFPSEPTVTSPPTVQPPQATPEEAASQERRQSLMTAVAQPTPEVQHEERAVVQRTLVLMARASFTTLSSLGPPLWLLLGMFGFIAIFGRITVGPWLGAGRRRRTGTVGWFDHDRGYGFIVDDDSEKQVFVHASHVRGRELGIGDAVSFRAIAGERRSFARAVRHRGDER